MRIWNFIILQLYRPLPIETFLILKGKAVGKRLVLVQVKGWEQGTEVKQTE